MSKFKFVLVLFAGFFSLYLIPVKVNAATLNPVFNPDKDAGIDMHAPTITYNNDYFIVAWNDYNGPDGARRSLVHFNLNELPADAQVTQASLSMHVISCGGEDASMDSQPIEVGQLNADWNSSSVNWNNQPSYSNSTSFTTGNCVIGNWESVNVTDIVRNWVDGEQSNYGFMIKPVVESGTMDWMRMYGGTSGVSNQRPRLNITYNYTPVEEPTTTTSTTIVSQTSQSTETTTSSEISQSTEATTSSEISQSSTSTSNPVVAATTSATTVSQTSSTGSSSNSTANQTVSAQSVKDTKKTVDTAIALPEILSILINNKETKAPIKDEVVMVSGEVVKIYGKALANGKVLIIIGDKSFDCSVGPDGKWDISINTKDVNPGSYKVKAQAQDPKKNKGSNEAEFFNLKVNEKPVVVATTTTATTAKTKASAVPVNAKVAEKTLGKKLFSDYKYYSISVLAVLLGGLGYLGYLIKIGKLDLSKIKLWFKEKEV